MKRLFLPLIAALFLLTASVYASCAPPTPIAQVATVTPDSSDDDLDEMIKRVLKQGDEEKPKEKSKIVKPKLGKGEHWVQLVRFTNVGVNDTSVKKLSDTLDEVNEAGVEVIVLELATPGGSMPAGQEMARVIERSKAPVHCVVDGDTASMGFYVLQSCKERMMTKRSTLLAHEPRYSAVDGGNQTDMKNHQDMLHAASENMLEHEAARLKVSKEELRKRTEHGQDWIMLYDEALKVGAVDDVVKTVESVVNYYKHTLKGHP